MALTPEQKASKLFKKSLGAGETLITRDFFEEPRLGRDFIFPDQIWSESDKIPTSAPTLLPNEINGVVQYIEKLSLSHVSGTVGKSYYSETLKDAIPFNYSDGSYNYTLYKSDGSTVIPFGLGDWLVDGSAGLLTFYGTLPSNVNEANPPQITFYKYIGEKGIPDNTSGFNIKDPVLVASTVEISNYDVNLSGYTSLPANIDGVTTFNEGDRILIKDQTDTTQNGIFVVSGTTLVRDELIVAVNDYVFVQSGGENMASSWVLNSSDASDPSEIISGENTEIWKLFSRSAEYQAGDALTLTGQEFDVNVDSSTISINIFNELEVSSSLVTQISINESDILQLSGITDTLESDIGSLESLTSTITSDLDSLESVVSVNIDNIISLESAVDDFTLLVQNIAGSGLTYDTLTETLNVKVDNYTIKIADDGSLIGSIQWIQETTSANISSTSGSTGLILNYNPVTPVSAYVNGVEYLVNLGTEPITNYPFFYNENPPVQGTEIWFDPITAGFNINSGLDIVVIKYNITEDI